MPTKKQTPAKRQKMQKQQKQNDAKASHAIIAFGYGLFIVTVISAVLPTVFMIQALAYPTANHFNIITFSLTIALAAVLPALIAYSVGDRATRNTSIQTHHLNGVLFGVAGYWILLFIGIIPNPFYPSTVNAVSYAVWSLVPIVITLLPLLAVGMLYARKTRHQTPLIHFTPFRVLLLAAFVLFFVSMAGLYVFNPYDQVAISFSGIAVALLPIAGIGIFFAIGYWRARSVFSRLDRALKSIIAITFGFSASILIGNLIAYMPIQQFDGGLSTMLASIGGGVAVWLAYLIASPDFK